MYTVVAEKEQPRMHISPKFYIGSGAITQLYLKVELVGSDCVKSALSNLNKSLFLALCLNGINEYF